MIRNGDYTYLIVERFSDYKSHYIVYNQSIENFEYLQKDEKVENGSYRYASIYDLDFKDVKEDSYKSLVYKYIDTEDFHLIDICCSKVFYKNVKKNKYIIVYEDIDNALVFATNCDLINISNFSESIIKKLQIYSSRILFSDKIYNGKKLILLSDLRKIMIDKK